MMNAKELLNDYKNYCKYNNIKWQRMCKRYCKRNDNIFFKALESRYGMLSNEFKEALIREMKNIAFKKVLDK